MRDQHDIAVGQQRRHPAEYLIGPLAYLFYGLAGMFGVAGDHAVPPQVPPGMLFLDLSRS